jgi:hypothetical protein
VGLPCANEHRNKKRRPDTVLVQLWVYAVLYSTVLLPERLVVAGHDGSDHSVVLAVVEMGRQALDMELIDTFPGHQMYSE